MSTQLTSKELRDRGWISGPALGQAIKLGNNLLENGTDLETVLAMLDDVLNRPSAYVRDNVLAKIADLLLQKTAPKRDDKVVGRCQICRRVEPLSFEHVPPQAALNNSTVIAYSVEGYLTGSKSRMDMQQGGFGRHTLCESCNNNTGSWYANEYANWAKTGYSILQQVGTKQQEILVTLKQVYPLRFLKQIVACFFSVNGIDSAATFAQNNSQLVDFIRDKHRKELSDYYQFYLRLDMTKIMRHFPIAGKIKLNFTKGSNGNIQQIRPVEQSIFSEITHLPFALIMTEDSSYSDATKITGFRSYGYNECVDLKISLKIGSSSKPIPGHYE